MTIKKPKAKPSWVCNSAQAHLFLPFLNHRNEAPLSLSFISIIIYQPKNRSVWWYQTLGTTPVWFQWTNLTLAPATQTQMLLLLHLMGKDKQPFPLWRDWHLLRADEDTVSYRRGPDSLGNTDFEIVVLHLDECWDGWCCNAAVSSITAWFSIVIAEKTLTRCEGCCPLLHSPQSIVVIKSCFEQIYNCLCRKVTCPEGRMQNSYCIPTPL